MTDDWERERKRLQEGVSVKTVQLEILEEGYQSAMSLAESNGWPEPDALRIIFANGLAFLTGEASLSKVQRTDLPQEALEDMNRVVRQLLEESSRYASLKFKAYRMSQDNQVLSMREAALRGELDLAKHRLMLFRQDEEALKQRLSALEQDNTALRQRLATLEPAPSQGGDLPPARRVWLTRLLPGRRRAKPPE
jgi:regulator of replication initiation timing